MIKVKVCELIESIDTFKNIITLPVKAKTAYQIARLIREIDKEVNLFQEKRADLIKKYATRDENNEIVTNDEGIITVDVANTGMFNQEINELLETTVELNANKITIDDFDCAINSQQMLAIMPFIEE